MKAKDPTSSKIAQVPQTIAVMTRELGTKDADPADGPGDEEVKGGDAVNDRELGAKDAALVDVPGDEEITGGNVFNDWVVIDDGGVIKYIKVVDTEDCKYALPEVENAALN